MPLGTLQQAGWSKSAEAEEALLEKRAYSSKQCISRSSYYSKNQTLPPEAASCIIMLPTPPLSVPVCCWHRLRGHTVQG